MAMMRYSDGLAVALESEYPKTAELMNASKEGTLVLLNAKEILKFGELSRSFDIPHDGDHPQDTWSAYKDVIVQWLEEKAKCTEAHLKPAREAVAENLRSAYYEKYPTWPDRGEQWPKYTLPAGMTGEYPYPSKYNKQYQVAFNVIGSIVVWDKTTEDGRYYCNIESPYGQSIKIQTVKLDFIKLKNFEKKLQCKLTFDTNLAIVQQTAISWESSGKELTYDNIDTITNKIKTAFSGINWDDV